MKTFKLHLSIGVLGLVSIFSVNTLANDGGTVYNTYCAVCHKSGLNAAPKMGQKAFWIKRVAQGKETVYKNSIEGIRGMPPKGGIASLTDEEVKAAVDYMVGRSGGWGDN
jgi:cytochrome c5